MSTGIRRTVAFVLIPLFLLPLAACRTWSRIEPPPVAATDTIRTYDRVRLHRTNGAALVLHDALVWTDSVVGYTAPREQPGARREAVSRGEIERIDRRTGDVLGTVAGVVSVTSIVVCTVTDCFDFGFGEESR